MQQLPFTHARNKLMTENQIKLASIKHVTYTQVCTIFLNMDPHQSLLQNMGVLYMAMYTKHWDNLVTLIIAPANCSTKRFTGCVQVK